MRIFYSLLILSALCLSLSAQQLNRLDSVKVDGANIWGVLADGTDNMAMTVSRGNIIYFQYMDKDLQQVTEQVAIYGPEDNLPQIVDHKTLFWKGSYYITFSAAGDRQLYIVKVDQQGNRIGDIITVYDEDEQPQDQPGKPTNDMIFIATDDALYVGHFIPANQHFIHAFDENLQRISEPFNTDISLEHNNVGGGLFVNDVIHLFTGSMFGGESDLVLTEWDKDFQPAASAAETIIESQPGHANWFATGVAHDAETGYWYIGFQHLHPGQVLDEEHVDIAVFDQCFNLIYREEITDERYFRPHMLIYDGHLYLSYDRAGNGVFLHKYELLPAGFGSDTCEDDGSEEPRIELSNQSILEGQAVGSTIGELSLVNGGDGEVVFSLADGLGGEGNSSFTIEGKTLKSAEVFDYELNSTYMVRIKASDPQGQQSLEANFTITITDVDESSNNAPTDIQLSLSSIAENNSDGDVIGALSAEDQDAGDAFGFQLVEGEGDDDNDQFEIEGDELLANAVFDFESKNSYSIRIGVRDLAGATFEKTFEITVTNEVEWSLSASGPLEFGDVPVESTESLTLSITNTGDDDGLQISLGNAPTGFSVNPTSLTLAAGATETVNVSFTPTATEVYSGNLVFTSEIDDLNVAVSGTGQMVTSIDDGSLPTASLKLYPNPATGVLSVDMEDATIRIKALELIDQAGASVLHKNGLDVQDYRLGVSTVMEGLYFLHVQTNKGTLIKKIWVRN